MTKNSSFLHFRAVFMRYCPQFWGSGVIYKVHDTQHMFERHDQKLIVFAFFCVLGQFSWAIAHSFGVPGWSIRPMTLSTCLRGMTKNSSFFHFRDVFVSYCPQFWDSGVIYKAHDTQHIFRGVTKNLSFLHLGPFSWDIAHSFRVPEWFTRSITLSTYLRGMTKNSSFWRFRAVFMTSCPQFWGSVVIYKVHDTQYMFKRHDQKHIVFVL
jgi:hypothetical protein